MRIEALLDAISRVLFYPITVLLILLSGWTLFVLGAFARSWLERATGRRPARDRYVAALDAVNDTKDVELDLHLQEVLQRAEIEASRALNAVRFAIRAGPSLGLMGTLIPMAAALGGLAKGDLPGLAEKMTTAFSSTVIGIAIGLIAYVVALVRESWTRADLDAVRFHAERLLRAAEL